MRSPALRCYFVVELMLVITGDLTGLGLLKGEIPWWDNNRVNYSCNIFGINVTSIFVIGFD